MNTTPITYLIETVNYGRKNLRTGKKDLLGLHGDNHKNLVGIIEFPNINRMILFKVLLEFYLSDKKNPLSMIWSNSLCRLKNGEYHSLSYHTLEVYIDRKKDKKRKFKKIVGRLQQDVSILFDDLRNEWYETKDGTETIFFRRNKYITIPSGDKHNRKVEYYFRSAEESFWRNFAGILDFSPEKVKISQLQDMGNLWTIIRVKPECISYIRDGFNLLIKDNSKCLRQVLDENPIIQV